MAGAGGGPAYCRTLGGAARERGGVAWRGVATRRGVTTRPVVADGDRTGGVPATCPGGATLTAQGTGSGRRCRTGSTVARCDVADVGPVRRMSGSQRSATLGLRGGRSAARGRCVDTVAPAGHLSGSGAWAGGGARMRRNQARSRATGPSAAASALVPPLGPGAAARPDHRREANRTFRHSPARRGPVCCGATYVEEPW